MREEIRLEIQEKITESFEKARASEPPKRKTITEEQRQEQVARYAELLMRATLRRL